VTYEELKVPRGECLIEWGIASDTADSANMATKIKRTEEAAGIGMTMKNVNRKIVGKTGRNRVFVIEGRRKKKGLFKQGPRVVTHASKVPGAE
jgi:hypothetical protein